MRIVKLPIYDLEAIVKAGEIEAWAFQEFQEKPDGLETIIKWREGIENIMTSIDADWVTLFKDDVSELTEWASRMRLVRNHLDEIDRQLAVKNSRLFNWDKVISSMGFVNAFRVAAEQVVSHNKQKAA